MLDNDKTHNPSASERIHAIREKAQFAKFQDQLGREAVEAAEDLPLIEREKKLSQADMHFTAYSDTVEQLVALIYGDALAELQLGSVERHLASLGM